MGDAEKGLIRIDVNETSSDDNNSDDNSSYVNETKDAKNGKYQCSICQEFGHNKRTCSKLPVANPVKIPTRSIKNEAGPSNQPLANPVKRPRNTKSETGPSDLEAGLSSNLAELQTQNQILTDENIGLRLQIEDAQALSTQNFNLTNEVTNLKGRLATEELTRINLERDVERRIATEKATFQRILEEHRTPYHPVLLRIAECVTCSVCGILSGEIPDEYPEEGIEYVHLACKNGHGICVECLTANVTAATNNLGVSVKCVREGCGQDFGDISKWCDRDVYNEYIKAKAVFEDGERRKKEEERNVNNPHVQNVDIANVAIVKTPCCNRAVCDFQACCKVSCDICKTSWCAWCFKVQGTMTEQEFYAHVHDCPFNPDKGAIYPTERGKQVMTQLWKARQAEQLAKASDFDLAKPRRY